MTNHTTPETSSEILRLCREKGVTPPNKETAVIGDDDETTLYSAFTVPALLMWSGWPTDHKYVILKKMTGGRYEAVIGSLYVTAYDSPAEALGLLLIEYLRTL